MLVQGVADALATQGQADEEDLALARDASPFYLKLSESLLKESPGNLKLAQSVASGFTQYAYAFVASEAERLAATDAKQAHALNERARRMYLRAHRHAMTALELSAPGFKARLMQATAPLDAVSYTHLDVYKRQLRAEIVGTAHPLPVRSRVRLRSQSMNSSRAAAGSGWPGSADCEQKLSPGHPLPAASHRMPTPEDLSLIHI